MMLPGLLLFAFLAQGPLPVETLARQARDDFQAARYAAARDKLREALKQSPSNPALWSYLGLAEAQLNDLDSAIADFQKTLTLAPDDAQSFFNLGLLYGRKNQTAKAVDAYQRGLKLEPNNAPAIQNYALLLMAQGRFREAAAPLERLRAREAGNLPVRLTLIDCYSKAGMKSELAREVQAALELPGLTSSDCLRLAKMLLEDHQRESAGVVLEHAASMTPESAEAHYDLGLLLLDKSEYEGATRELGRAAQLDPTAAPYALRLAESLILWKHYGTALEFLMAVKDRFGSLPDYRYKLGLTYYSLHQFPRAIAQFEEVASEQPQLDTIQFFLGNCYGGVGDLEKAEAHYRRAIEIQPRNASYYTALAQVLRNISDENTDEAIADLEKALSLDASNTQSKHELSLCFIKKADYAKARDLLEQVVAKEPDLTSAHVALAQTYYKLRQKQDGNRESGIVRRLQAEERARQAALRNASPRP
jgi:tetratricopeptide (TPR) repeat protein